MNQWLTQRLQEQGFWYYILVALSASLLIFFLGYPSVQPAQHEFLLNQVSDVTVRAPRTIEDEALTEEHRKKAAAEVADIYSFQPAISQEQVQLLEDFFTLVRHLNSETYTSRDLSDFNEAYQGNLDHEAFTGRRSFGDLGPTWQQALYHQALDQASPDLQDYAGLLSLDLMTELFGMKDEALIELQAALTEQLEAVLQEELDQSNLDSAKQELQGDLWRQGHQVLDVDSQYALVEPLLVPTIRYDEQLTDQARQKAQDQVQASYILQGEVIAQEGHVIDEKTYHQLSLFGFIDQTTHRTKSYFFGLFLLVHLILSLILIRAYLQEEGLSQRDQVQIGMSFTAYYLLLTLALALVALLYYLELQEVSYAAWLLPVGLMTLLGQCQLTKWQTLILNLNFSFLSLFYINTPNSPTQGILAVIFYLISSSLFLIDLPQVSEKHPVRASFGLHLLLHLLVVGPALAAVNIEIFSQLGLELMTLVTMNIVLVYSLRFFIEPYWLQVWNDRAPLTLQSLSNLNHPLLKELIERAPGTYHHSLMVANLAANAVEAIQGDSLLTRVAGYYHDVGKMAQPLFFIENLPSGLESPHQMLSPQESAQVIIDHVARGVQVLEDYGMPQSIIDLCREHHGTTLVAYFYYQAKQEDSSTSPSDYQYSGPSPQSKEAMVLMLADSLEAASRTLDTYEPERIEGLVDSIIDQKLQEGQFTDSSLTVTELEIVRRSLVSGIASIYHTRIEYPTERG